MASETSVSPTGNGTPAHDPERSHARSGDPGRPRRRRRGIRRVIGRTLDKAWGDSIFSMAAQAAFWQALSLPPLFLALLGSLGYVGGWFGPDTVRIVEGKIVQFSRQVFTPEVVDQIIAPTAASILTIGRADLVSTGFVISLWAGSSAISSLVDSITEAHSQYDVRHPVWQRVFSLLIYLFALVAAVFTLPIVALGPDLLPEVLPEAWRPTATSIIGAFYYPGAGLLLVLVLTALYKVALPHSLPWRRLLPGALLAMLVFIVSTTGLRVYMAVITTTGYTYGALATPIAFLLFAFLLGFSIVLGAQLNNAVEEVWPSRPTRRQRRLRRMLSMRRIAARALSPAGPDGAGNTGPSGPVTGSGAAAPDSDRVTPDLPANGLSAHAAAGPRPARRRARDRAVSRRQHGG
ncbi:YihY/virulence factor BrkB family protein [Pseudonocardia bannensis]|uniref:YihY/virulence factor BrkB family protein n=1 Tax=Pseudonocardia bannensis TaxID=630973 RepID=A0A848DMS6_9PSEU|nr:YihY/virulence factor BrkB family protein [Pseudonocardia bannensis]NMH93731.1 YihY/virulence factor BrkB family protein [Pseudonocardia bannensis]